jgi:hypothetical protein
MPARAKDSETYVKEKERVPDERTLLSRSRHFAEIVVDLSDSHVGEQRMDQTKSMVLSSTGNEYCAALWNRSQSCCSGSCSNLRG